jgi:RNA polymerase sigma-70 factor (ECF subfamily)
MRAIEAAQGGDVQAFNQLVLTYQTAAFNVALRTVGNPDDAADATQDAFISAYRAIRDFRGGSFKAWLLRIVVNACYDILRRRQRRPARSLEEMSEHSESDVSPVDTKIGPDRFAMDAETAASIQRALDELPDEQRAVVVLCDVQGLSYEEASAAMQIALGTIKSRLSRARARLRDILTERGELPGAS